MIDDTSAWDGTGGGNEVGCWHHSYDIVVNGTNTHACVHTHISVHANSDIMHGCPLRFIIKALSDCAGSEGENMNRIKQIVWCVKDRHSSSKVLKLLLPMDWQGRVAGRNESALLFYCPPLFHSWRGVSRALRHCLCKVPVSAWAVSIK